MKALFPRVAEVGLQTVLLNTAGGITGGDTFNTSLTAGEGTELTVTTQAAERAYRSLQGDPGIVVNELTVMPDARLNWLPQETILFDGSALNRRLHVDLAQDAQLLMCEPLVFGRAAMGETLTGAHLTDHIQINRGGSPLYLDRMNLAGDIEKHLSHPHIGDGAGALCTLLYVAPDAEARLDPIRALMPETGGASLLQEDLLILRALAPDSFEMRRFLVPILNLLTHDTLPRPWMI